MGKQYNGRRQKYKKYQSGSARCKGRRKKVKDLCNSLAEDVNKMEQDFERLNSKVLDQEFRSMPDNLIFYRIHESGPGQNIDAEQEKCDLLVKELI